jgi:hypothetical protein
MRMGIGADSAVMVGFIVEIIRRLGFIAALPSSTVDDASKRLQPL